MNFNFVGDFNEANATSELSAHTNWDRTLDDSSMITPLKPSGGERWRFEARRVPVKGFAPGWTRRKLPLAHLTPREHREETPPPTNTQARQDASAGGKDPRACASQLGQDPEQSRRCSPDDRGARERNDAAGGGGGGLPGGARGIDPRACAVPWAMTQSNLGSRS
jgi:hypothetical protein